MSEDNPDDPRNPPPRPEQEEPSAEREGSRMLLGMALGALALYVLYLGLPMAFAGPYNIRFLTGPSAFIPIAVYLAVAIVLAVRPRTSRWGAGLLIGLGIFTLLGGGICVGYLAQMRA
jgi:hypothetical protein